MIAVACPSCGTAYEAPADLAGTRVRCRECRAVVSVPGQRTERRLKDGAGDDPRSRPAVTPKPKANLSSSGRRIARPRHVRPNPRTWDGFVRLLRNDRLVSAVVAVIGLAGLWFAFRLFGPPQFVLVGVPDVPPLQADDPLAPLRASVRGDEIADGSGKPAERPAPSPEWVPIRPSAAAIAAARPEGGPVEPAGYAIDVPVGGRIVEFGTGPFVVVEGDRSFRERAADSEFSRVIDLRTGEEFGRFPNRHGVEAITPDGRFGLCKVLGNSDLRFETFQTANGLTRGGDFVGPVGKQTLIALAATDERFVCVAVPQGLRPKLVGKSAFENPPPDSRLMVISPSTGKLLIDRPIAYYAIGPEAAAVDPTGRFLTIATPSVALGVDGTLLLYDLDAGGEPIGRLRLDTETDGRVTAVAFSPDGQRLAILFDGRDRIRPPQGPFGGVNPLEMAKLVARGQAGDLTDADVRMTHDAVRRPDSRLVRIISTQTGAVTRTIPLPVAAGLKSSRLDWFPGSDHLLVRGGGREFVASVPLGRVLAELVEYPTEPRGDAFRTFRRPMAGGLQVQRQGRSERDRTQLAFVPLPLEGHRSLAARIRDGEAETALPPGGTLRIAIEPHPMLEADPELAALAAKRLREAALMQRFAPLPAAAAPKTPADATLQLRLVPGTRDELADLTSGASLWPCERGRVGPKPDDRCLALAFEIVSPIGAALWRRTVLHELSEPPAEDGRLSTIDRAFVSSLLDAVPGGLPLPYRLPPDAEPGDSIRDDRSGPSEEALATREPEGTLPMVIALPRN